MEKVFGFLIIMILSSSCASLNEKGKRVKLTHSEEDVKSCLRIQEVTTLPPYILSSDWKIKIRNAAGKVGADTVLTSSFPLSPKVKGQAYRCDN